MNIWKLSWNNGYVVVSMINTFSMNQNGLLITSLCLTLSQNISQLISELILLIIIM